MFDCDYFQGDEESRPQQGYGFLVDMRTFYMRTFYVIVNGKTYEVDGETNTWTERPDLPSSRML